MSLVDILRIESVQRVFTKSLATGFNLSYVERLKKCNFYSLEKRRLFADMVLFFKVVNNVVYIDFGSSLHPVVDSLTRGHSRRFHVSTARTNTRHHSYLNRCVRIWNDLSECCVNAENVNIFKTCIAKHDFSKYLSLDF